MNSFDVLIIGGGLAGKTTALHLSMKGHKVLILEKNNSKKKIPCAGGMAASVRQYLPLDIDSIIETQVKNVHFTWQSKDDIVAELSGESPFLVINRARLENMLISKAFNLGTQMITSINIKNLFKKDNFWIINCTNNLTFKSKFLVIADGSESKWSTRLKLGPRNPKYANTVALRLQGLGNINKNSVRFDFGSIKYGFAWAFPLKEAINIGIGTFIGNYKLDSKLLQEKITNTFGFTDVIANPIYKRLRVWNGFHKLHGDRSLVIGDAASLCDPFLAEGIRPCLISSYYAYKFIDQCLSNDKNDLSEYSKKIKKEWSNSMVWGQRIAEVFYRFPKTGYNLGIKRKSAPKRIAQILSGNMSYADIAGRVIKRLLLKNF